MEVGEQRGGVGMRIKYFKYSPHTEPDHYGEGPQTRAGPRL